MKVAWQISDFWLLAGKWIYAVLMLHGDFVFRVNHLFTQRFSATTGFLLLYFW